MKEECAEYYTSWGGKPHGLNSFKATSKTLSMVKYDVLKLHGCVCVPSFLVHYTTGKTHYLVDTTNY